MAFVGKVQIDNGDILPVGSTLYGVCNELASEPTKIVILNDFTTIYNGITIHVKFTNGNTADTITLKVGTTNAYSVSNPGGTLTWAAGTVASFTFDSTDSTWIANDGTVPPAASVDNTYIPNSSNAISGQGVADALNDLGDAAQKDIISSIIESGTGANKDSTDLPTTAAITAYVDTKTAGITGAMHFKGRTTTAMSDGLTTATVIINGSNYTPNPGDVVLSGDHQEYVWTETNSTTHAGYWELLGDEGSYALKTNTGNVIKTVTFTPDVPGTLSTKNTTIPNVTSAGSAATMVVESGVLKITTGSAPTLGTAITIKEVDTWTAGTAASLNTTNQTVIIPEST